MNIATEESQLLGLLNSGSPLYLLREKLAAIPVMERPGQFLEMMKEIIISAGPEQEHFVKLAVNLYLYSIRDKYGLDTFVKTVDSNHEFARGVSNLVAFLEEQGIASDGVASSSCCESLFQTWCTLEKKDEVVADKIFRSLVYLLFGLEDENVWDLVIAIVRSYDANCPIDRLIQGHRFIFLSIDRFKNVEKAKKLVDTITAGWRRRLTPEAQFVLMQNSLGLTEEVCQKFIEQERDFLSVNEFAGRAIKLLAKAFPDLTWKMGRFDLGQRWLFLNGVSLSEEEPYPTHEMATEVLLPLKSEAKRIAVNINLCVETKKRSKSGPLSLKDD